MYTQKSEPLVSTQGNATSLDRSVSSETAPLAALFLERALLVTILAHAAAMVSMGLLLLPGMPGGGNPTTARVAYIAGQPWLWRLGWLPWQLTALSDLVLAIALLRTSWIPRVPAIVVLITTLVAILIEQPGELAWTTTGVALAQAALQTGNLTLFMQFEASIYLRVAAWAATMYTITALGWTWCFVKAKVWRPGLTWLSLVTWGILMLVSVGPLLPDSLRPDAGIIAAGNAIGFILLLAWLCIIAELVLRRSRPISAHGRMAVWRHPRNDLFGQIFNVIAASRLARAYAEWVPPVAFMSNITNVIYANYLVEAETLLALVPPGLELQRLGPDGKYALFTHLTYQHGHFGPQLLGPFRRFMPSPVQSNWRIYVHDARTSRDGIYFVTTAINMTMPALLARLLSEGIPMHVVARGAVIAKPDGAFEVILTPGPGSAPDLALSGRLTSQPALTGSWGACFDTFHDLLAYCVPQDRAMSSQPWYRRITRQEIELGIPLESCEPLTASVESRAATAIVGNAEPICFRVANVLLRFKREEHDYFNSRI